MAGDWIKMRGNLWDDPRVSRICDITDQSEAAIIGGLYWLWATADQHTEDGIMPGLTLRQIDRKTGVKGIAEALCSVGWLADHPEGVRIVRFVEHNGSSAKRRCMEAQRKANARHVSASDADNVRTDEGQNPPFCGAREEKRREDISTTDVVDMEPPQEAAKPKKEPKRALEIPAEFYPNENGVNYAEKNRVNIAIELQRMRNWAESNAITKKDWQATWRTWCDKAVEFGRAGAKSASAINGKESIHERRANTVAALTGRTREQHAHGELDITGVACRVD